MADEGRERRRGRRPAADGADTRSLILAAAAAEFSDRGYDGASMRAIARRAEVDPALVRHYFADKADLFAETLQAPARPDRILATVLAGPRERIGENLVRAILTTLDRPPRADRMISLVRTALGHDFAARMLREFLVREVFGRIADALDVDDAELRAALAASQMVGLLVVRYGVRAAPVAHASIEELARRVGPVVQHHLLGGAEPARAGDSRLDADAGDA